MFFEVCLHVFAMYGTQRMAAKLFEIEMQITCTNVLKNTTVMYVNYLAPVTDKKNLRCGRPPHAKRGELPHPHPAVASPKTF